MKGNTPSYAKPISVSVKPGLYHLPTLMQETGMADSKGEARRMIKSGGGIWIDRYDWNPDVEYGSKIWERLERVNKFMDGEDIYLFEDQSLCFGKTTYDAVCHRINFRKVKI